ncbi:MAG: hypothetical protein GY795_41200 [Desulfobacterales bacterium]|nr:hypothetical protein [Desulfobacterales bacterium]
MKKTFIITLVAALLVFFAVLSAYALVAGMGDETEYVKTGYSDNCIIKENMVNFNPSDGSGFSRNLVLELCTNILFGISLIAMGAFIKTRRSKKTDQAQIPLQTCMLSINSQPFYSELKQHSNLKV